MVELHPAFCSKDGETMYKVGYRHYMEESDLLKELDRGVDNGLFASCEVRHNNVIYENHGE